MASTCRLPGPWRGGALLIIWVRGSPESQALMGSPMCSSLSRVLLRKHERRGQVSWIAPFLPAPMAFPIPRRGGGGAGVVVEAGLELEDKDICQHRAGIWSLTMPGIELQAFH